MYGSKVLNDIKDLEIHKECKKIMHKKIVSELDEAIKIILKKQHKRIMHLAAIF